MLDLLERHHKLAQRPPSLNLVTGNKTRLDLVVDHEMPLDTESLEPSLVDQFLDLKLQEHVRSRGHSSLGIKVRVVENAFEFVGVGVVTGSEGGESLSACVARVVAAESGGGVDDLVLQLVRLQGVRQGCLGDVVSAEVSWMCAIHAGLEKSE